MRETELWGLRPSLRIKEFYSLRECEIVFSKFQAKDWVMSTMLNLSFADSKIGGSTSNFGGSTSNIGVSLKNLANFKVILYLCYSMETECLFTICASSVNIPVEIFSHS